LADGWWKDDKGTNQAPHRYHVLLLGSRGVRAAVLQMKNDDLMKKREIAL
jgi:hypothetical protein